MASWNSLAIISRFSRTMTAPRGARLRPAAPHAARRLRGQPAAALGPSHGRRARGKGALALDGSDGLCIQPFVCRGAFLLRGPTAGAGGL